MRIMIGGTRNSSSASSSLKFLVKITIILSLLCSVADQLNIYFFGFSLSNLFLLNHLSITNFFLWQPLTSILLIPIGPISIGALYDLLVPIYFLWTFGKSLEQLLGTRGVLSIYFISGIASSLASLLVMYLTGEFRLISCSTSAILGLCTIWAISFNYHSQSLLMLMPLTGRWVLLFALCGTMMSELLNKNIPAAVAFFAAFLTSYMLSVFYWGFQGPIKSLWSFESFLKINFRKYRSILSWKLRTGVWRRLITFNFLKKSNKEKTSLVVKPEILD